ncbi:putative protein family protein [Golovinomyces cichoracearum]|uniref:Outer spore wall protein RRT8 n=1 Tax=Golovinomyces cichoracearum TaxID=62708 RepID=A0A420IBV7_9PEZI|nr:putative protein family protein [Golovinomyces cichoracearum]
MVTPKVGDVTKDLNNFQTLVRSTVKSEAYMYPVKPLTILEGILYFLANRSLWKPLFSQLIPVISLSISVIAFMFFFAFVPQLAVLTLVNGPLAIFTTVFLTLSESSVIVNFLAKSFLLHEALLDTFDGVLLLKKQSGLLKGVRELKVGHLNDPIAKLGKLAYSPFQRFSLEAFINYLLYLPLNLIPVVGVIVFIIAQGRSRGRVVHNRYFNLKQWDRNKQNNWLNEKIFPYTIFGTFATLLEMVPCAGMFFSFTNTVGAALWAADIESRNSRTSEQSQGENILQTT